MNKFIERTANKNSLAHKRLVCGMGVNDASYIVLPEINGKRVMCPYYLTWVNMLKRCYSASYQEKKPTYKGCSVAEEWLVFSNFKVWMVRQDWRGRVLDKDILEPGNKLYNSETCVFVTEAVNALLNDHQSKRGYYPQGVCLHKLTGKFVADCSFDGVRRHLGIFATADEASSAYNIFKSKLIREVAGLQTDIRIRGGLLKHAALRLQGVLK